MDYFNTDIATCKMEKQDFCFQNSAFKCLIYIQKLNLRFLDKKMRWWGCFTSVAIVILSYSGQAR